uniref:Uncharacterized protein n=1 Tax=Ciona savignyi TaxID=51511 RepID=H2ZLF1_CIOSA
MEASSQEVEENAQSEDLPDLKSGVQLEAVGKEAHLNEEAVSPLNGESVNSEEGNGQSVKDPIIPDVEFKEEKQSISPISPTPSDLEKENETVENKSDEMLNKNNDISSMNSKEENNTEAKSVQEDIMSKNSMTQETSLDHNEDSEVLNQTDEDGEKVESGNSPDVGETKDSDHISGVGEEKAKGEITSPIVENTATEDQMSNEEDGEVKDVVDDSTSTFEAVQSKNNANEIENLQEVIKV